MAQESVIIKNKMSKINSKILNAKSSLFIVLLITVSVSRLQSSTPLAETTDAQAGAECCSVIPVQTHDDSVEVLNVNVKRKKRRRARPTSQNSAQTSHNSALNSVGSDILVSRNPN